jgi:hypothetical protein
MVDPPAPEATTGSDPVEVGVLLDLMPEKIGEWLADAAAYDAGGADALWIDAGPEPELDVLAVAAALAVITFRARLVVALPSAGNAPAGLARTLDTITRLSHGRLVLVADRDQCAELAVLVPGTAILHRVAGGYAGAEAGVEAGAMEGLWVTAPPPEGRASWQAALAEAAGRGAGGLVVPAGPRLLDILRNPDDPGDRTDLQLAQG